MQRQKKWSNQKKEKKEKLMDERERNGRKKKKRKREKWTMEARITIVDRNMVATKFEIRFNEAKVLRFDLFIFFLLQTRLTSKEIERIHH